MRFKLIARKQSCCKTGKYPALRGPPQTSGEKHAARTIRREWTPPELLDSLHRSYLLSSQFIQPINQSINMSCCSNTTTTQAPVTCTCPKVCQCESDCKCGSCAEDKSKCVCPTAKCACKGNCSCEHCAVKKCQCSSAETCSCPKQCQCESDCKCGSCAEDKSKCVCPTAKCVCEGNCSCGHCKKAACKCSSTSSCQC